MMGLFHVPSELKVIGTESGSKKHRENERYFCILPPSNCSHHIIVSSLLVLVSLKLQKRLAASVLKCGERKIWLDPNEVNEITLANSRRNIKRLHRDGLIIKKPTVVHSRARVVERNEAKTKGRHTGTCLKSNYFNLFVMMHHRLRDRTPRSHYQPVVGYLVLMTVVLEGLEGSVYCGQRCPYTTPPARQPEVHIPHMGMIYSFFLCTNRHRTTFSPLFELLQFLFSPSHNCNVHFETTGTGKRRGTANARLPLKVLWMRRARVLRRLLKKMRDAKKIDKHIYHSLYMLAKGNQFKNKRVLLEVIHDKKGEMAKEKALVEQAEARKSRAKTRLDRKAAKIASKQNEEPATN